MSPRVRSLAALLLALTTSACPSKPPPKSWPDGTVFAVNGVPVDEAEVTQVAGWVRHATFEGSESHYKRLAVEQVILPRAAIASQRQEVRAEKLALANEVRAGLVDGRPGPTWEEADGGPFEEIRSGNLSNYGIETLGVALELEVGEWSDIVESPGVFYLVRKIAEPIFHPSPNIELGIIEIPYLEHGVDSRVLNEFMDRSTLEIVADEYRELITERVKYQMAPKDE